MTKPKFHCDTCNKSYRYPSEWKRHCEGHHHKMKTDTAYVESHKRKIRDNHNARCLRYYHKKRDNRVCKMVQRNGYVAVIYEQTN